MAEVTGVYGISAVLVLFNLVAVAVLGERGPGLRRLVPALAVLTLLVTVLPVAGWRRAAALAGRTAGHVRVALAQGNVEQDQKWDPARQDVTLARYRQLTRAALAARPDLIVWPETATPFFFQEPGPLRQDVLDLATESRAYLLFGSPAYRQSSRGALQELNRAYLVSPDGREVATYDKIQLVPFGEYVPFEAVLFFVQRLVVAIGDVVPGHEPTVFRLPAGRFGVLICYEDVFPALTRRFVAGGADYQRTWQESDMAFSWAWSGRILEGDVLGRDTIHPNTQWMRDMAPLESWERWWGGKHVFHQAPLYAYALAAARLVAGDGFWGVGLCQALMGVGSVALVFLLAAQLFAGAVPAIAALGAALYGPFLLHEPLLVRDSLGVTTSLLLLWWLARCDAGVRRWLVAGALFALALLARESTLLFGPLIGLWIVQRFRAEPRILRRAALALVAGAALGFAPLVARNLAVGAPPLSFSTRALDTFVYGNAADSSLVSTRIPSATRTILEQADGHLGRAIRLTLATYDGDWRRLVANEWFKLRAIFARS